MAYAVQIANPQLVQKIEWLAQTLQLGKTAVVDRAVDLLTAQLNFGDLFSYATAKSRGLPLLYKGNDICKPMWKWCNQRVPPSPPPLRTRGWLALNALFDWR